MRVVSSTVTRELNVQVVAPIDGPSQVGVSMRYDTADPYAVHAMFRVAVDQQVSWVFARELLSPASKRPRETATCASGRPPRGLRGCVHHVALTRW